MVQPFSSFAQGRLIDVPYKFQFVKLYHEQLNICCKKNQQQACKPGSVSVRLHRCLSFIYDPCRHEPLSFYPPAQTDRLLFLFAGIHELSTPGMHSTDVTTGLVGSCPTFSPLPLSSGRLFSSALSDPRESLLVRKRDVLRCPDFPLAINGQRQAGLLLVVGKVTKKC